jgi:hypothetical protein
MSSRAGRRTYLMIFNNIKLHLKPNIALAVDPNRPQQAVCSKKNLAANGKTP